MKVIGNQLYLIHVKEGFDAKIRDLTNQVYVSANRLQNDLSTDSIFLKGIHESYTKANPHHTFFTLDDFLNLFRNYEIIFAAAFCSGNVRKKVFKNIRSFRSNIAKVSIIQAVNEMRNFPYELKIFEIENIYE
jgi:hypothetical protein